MKRTTLGSLISPAPLVRCGDGDYPVLSMTMHDGIILQSNRFKKNLASKDLNNYKIVRHGQLVVGFPIDEGVLYIQKVVPEGVMSPAYNVWNVNSDEIYPDYLELCLHSPQSMFYYKSKLRGTTARRRSIPTVDLLALPICLPSMERQIEIVSIINKVNVILSNYQKQLAKLDELVKSRFIEMFGDPQTNSMNWNIATIGDVISSCEAGWSGNGKQRGKRPGEIAVLKVSAVTKGYFIPEECKVLDDQNNIKKYIYPQKGDLLFSRANTREMVGATAIIQKDYPEHILPDKLWRIRFTANSNVYYMKCILSSKAIRDRFSAESTGTSGSMYNVSMEKFRSVQIPIPPLELQEQFAAFVQTTDKSKLTIQESLNGLETLKKSLMQEYFG